MGRVGGVYNAVLVGCDHQLGSIPRLELGQEPGDVGLGRGVGDEEMVSDLSVGHPRGDGGKYLHLPLCQGAQFSCWTDGAGAPAELLDQLTGGARCQQGVTRCDHADRFEQPVGLGVFGKEPAGPRPECGVDVFVVVEGRQDQHASGRGSWILHESPGGLESVDSGHSDVHQHHIGVLLTDERERGEAIGGEPD